MSILKKLFKSKNPDSIRFKRDMAEHLNGRPLKCVLERKPDGIETVIGKDGAIVVKDDVLRVYSGPDVLFATRVEDLRAGELLSLEGVIITSPDMEHGDEVRSIVAYYKYWRKLDD